MTLHLLQQYDEITAVISRYEAWVRKASLRLALPLSIAYWKNFRGFHRHYREIDFLRARQPSFITSRSLEVPLPKDEEGRQFHKVLFSEYPIHELSLILITRFPNVNFATVSTLHKLRSTQISRLNISALVGFVFGLGTLVLKSVPKPVIEPFMNYDEFQIWVFWGTLAFVAYLALVLAPLWIKYASAKRRHAFLSELLEYAVLITLRPDA